MAQSTFALRFGFARWLKHLEAGEAPSHAEIGRAVERTGQAVSGWSAAPDPPPDWKVHEPLAAYLGVAEGWLVKNRGEPPHPELWPIWTKHRRATPPAVEVVPGPQKPEPGVQSYLTEQEKKTAAKKGGRNGGTKAG